MKQTIYSKVFDKLVANERTVNADSHKSDLLVSVSILVLLFSAVDRPCLCNQIIYGGTEMNYKNMTVEEFKKLSNQDQLKVLAQMGYKSLSKAPLRKGIAGKNF